MLMYTLEYMCFEIRILYYIIHAQIFYHYIMDVSENLGNQFVYKFLKILERV